MMVNKIFYTRLGFLGLSLWGFDNSLMEYVGVKTLAVAETRCGSGDGGVMSREQVDQAPTQGPLLEAASCMSFQHGTTTGGI